MQRIWKKPTGDYSRLYADMLNQTHLLIAGATGSGKSTVVNGIITAGLYKAPCDVRFILIDPKGTELKRYSDLPHTIMHVVSMDDCISALQYAYDLTMVRYADMSRKGLQEYKGSDVYVVIDELMFLLNRKGYKQQAMNLLQDILVIARAAHVHVIACTQSPTKDTGLPVNLRCNFDSRLGLRTSTEQDSRNIIGIKDCAHFPKPAVAHIAYGMYMQGGDMELYQIPKVESAEIDRLIKHWQRHGRGRIALFRH